MNSITNKESYAERRQLFKNIWETAMNINEDEVINKPKVIKTLRLSHTDGSATAKKKKQRLKNLRHVCNKILDFCDKQDADDVYCQQMELGEELIVQHKNGVRSKKNKTGKGKKKVNRTKSMFTPLKVVPDTQVKVTASEQKNEIPRKPMRKISRSPGGSKIKKTSFGRKTLVARLVKARRSPQGNVLGAMPMTSNSLGVTEGFSNMSTPRHRALRKRNSKKKKPMETNAISKELHIASN